jgi:hypothetical protein
MSEIDAQVEVFARRLRVARKLLRRPASPQLVEAGVVNDPVEPGARRAVAPEAGDAAKRLRVRLLEHVVHRVAITEQSKREHSQVAIVRFDHRREICHQTVGRKSSPIPSQGEKKRAAPRSGPHSR